MMYDSRRCWLGVLLGLMWSVGAWAQQAGEQPILTLDRHHPLLPNTSGEPMVQIFGSGVVKINRPAGFVDPGQYTVQLSADELRNLMRLMSQAQNPHAALALLQFDDADASNPERELEVRSDETLSTLSYAPVLYSDDYSGGAPGAGGEVGPDLQSVAVEKFDSVPDSAARSVDSLRDMKQTMLDLFARAGESR